MSEQRLRRVLWLQAVVIVALAAALAYFTRGGGSGAGREAAEEGGAAGEETAPSRVVAAGGVALVRISPAAQQAGGIRAAPAAAYLMPSRREAYGVVVDPRPLLELRARLLAARDEQAAAAAAAGRADAEQRRTAALFADDRNASQKALEAAEAEARAAAAKLAAAAAAADGIDAQLRQGWGERLAALARQAASADLARLAERRDTLVQIVVPGEAPAAASLRLIGAAAVLPARLVSAAPQADPALAGAAWFYRAAGALPVGARVSAELTGPGKSRPGIRVPASAIVWHAGSPWIYLQRDAQGFERRAAQGAEAVGEDWFVAGVPAGAKVVTEGAQVLLSEELRYQIKNENED